MTDLPDVKLKALISFPANVLDGTGVDVVKANGTYQFNLDFGDFAPPAAAVTDSAQQNALLWNANTGAYSLVPISVLLTGSTPSDALPLMDGIAAAGVSALYSRGDHKHPTDTSLVTAMALLVETVKVQKFTASGTYTPSAGLLYAVIECLGAGGSGGGAVAAANGAGAGGGGAGGRAVKYSTAAAVGASQTVTIGAGGAAPSAGNNPGNAGGDTSVGSLCIAKGGSGGAGSGGADNIRLGGAGGIAGTGDVTGTGASGFSGNGMNSVAVVGGGGSGASSPWGGGGQPAGSVSGAGGAGTGFGSGGAGGASFNSSGAVAGGAGAPGLVIITEFCSQ